jgi:hypothetical protein
VATLTHQTQITERDLAFLRGLFESRVMTLAHAASLHFNGSVEAAKKRTQRLKRARYINERPRSRTYDPSILFLARRGFETLRRTGQLADYPAIGWESMERRAHVSPFTLQHELDVLSTKAALISKLRTATHHRVAEFSTWPWLFAFKARQQTADGYGRAVMMKPDAFVRIQIDGSGDMAPRQSSFYLELDRSTETQQNLRGRASGYLDFYRTGGFAKRCGQTPESFRQFPFRVLWIFRNAERRNNAAESFLRHHPPILTMAWLTTFDELVKNPMGDIWIRPVDYQRVIRGTPFDPIRHSPTNFYRRQKAREQFVEARITKSTLLTETEKSDPSLDRL